MTINMVTVCSGDELVELVRNTSDRLVIVAPYIKSPPLRRLLDAIPDCASECICVTRWLPEDIVSGVCDLEILDDLAGARGGRLLVQPHLHAKYYSNGLRTLVGSANLTSRGLGWHIPSNVELLVEVQADSPGLAAWEEALLSSALEATEQLRDQIRLRAEELEQAGASRGIPEVELEVSHDHDSAFWIPRCPAPERLWQVYRARGEDTMVSSAFEAAKEDLAALSPPQGLTQELFTSYVASILKQMPLFTDIDILAADGLTDRKARDVLADRLRGTGQEGDYGQAWRVVKQWLIYYFPESYRLETGQEVLVKGRELPRR